MWHAPHSLAHPYFAGCVAATLTAFTLLSRCVAATLIAFTLQGVLLPPLLHYTLLSRVCHCHPYYIHFAGCVAATLTALHIIVQGVLLPPLLHSLCRVCCCHPYYSHVTGCVAATLYYTRVHPTTIVPFTAKQLCSSVVFVFCMHF